jgi:hypothetical protein
MERLPSVRQHKPPSLAGGCGSGRRARDPTDTGRVKTLTPAAAIKGPMTGGVATGRRLDSATSRERSSTQRPPSRRSPRTAQSDGGKYHPPSDECFGPTAHTGLASSGNSNERVSSGDSSWTTRVDSTHNSRRRHARAPPRGLDDDVATHAASPRDVTPHRDEPGVRRRLSRVRRRPLPLLTLPNGRPSGHSRERRRRVREYFVTSSGALSTSSASLEISSDPRPLPEQIPRQRTRGHRTDAGQFGRNGRAARAAAHPFRLTERNGAI